MDSGRNVPATLIRSLVLDPTLFQGIRAAGVCSTIEWIAFQSPEIPREREYRVGLNLFNSEPERGIRYFIQRGFVGASPKAVAAFLLSENRASKQRIGEYLGSLQNSFNMDVLECFVKEIDLTGMQVDFALREFLAFFRMPVEAHKIDRFLEVFSHRYVGCNKHTLRKFHDPKTAVHILACAIMLLNADLHSPNIKAKQRMKLEEFIKNLTSVEEVRDLNQDLLVGMYRRIKSREIKSGSDHVCQVLNILKKIVGQKPNLALPDRNLVFYCRLYEVDEVKEKRRSGVNQRGVFLFNNLLMVTIERVSHNLFKRNESSISYIFKECFPLCGMRITQFQTPNYPHGIKLSQKVSDKVLIKFNARNDVDRSNFVKHLEESILETDELENLKIEDELEKKQDERNNTATRNTDLDTIQSSSAENSENRESIPQLTVAINDVFPETISSEKNLKCSSLTIAPLCMHEQQLNDLVPKGYEDTLESEMTEEIEHELEKPIVITDTGEGNEDYVVEDKEVISQPTEDGNKISPQTVVSESNLKCYPLTNSQANPNEKQINIPLQRENADLLESRMVSADHSLNKKVVNIRSSNLWGRSEGNKKSGDGYSRRKLPDGLLEFLHEYNFKKYRTPYDLWSTDSISMYSEAERKRHYNIGIQLFKIKPKLGIDYLVEMQLVGTSNLSIAAFLLTREELGKDLVDEYIEKMYDTGLEEF